MEFLWNVIMEQIPNFLGVNGMLGNFFGFDKNIQNLASKIEKLTSKETDVKLESEWALESQPGRKRKREVVAWFRSIERKKIEFQSIPEAATGRKFYSLASLLSRLRLGKRVEDMIEEVVELIEWGNSLQGRELTLDAHEIRDNSILTTGLVLVPTFLMNCEKIWECLMDDEVSSIGIYGMGGVGKTATVEHIHNRILKNPDNFGNVFLVTISENFSIDGLQNDFYKKLCLDLMSDDDERTKAINISNAFIRNKSILILDDVWEPISMKRVGIPVGVNGFKLVITTRLWDVCRKIGCQSNIKIEALSEKEAWELFLEKLGSDVELPPEVEKIAKLVAKKCGGLPLGIITMAGSMRGVNNIHEWRNVLAKLEQPTTGQSDLESEVLPVLTLSYDRLKNKSWQNCFLYCALFGEDYEIEREELIRYFIAEGLMNKGKSRQAEIDEGHSVLNKLKNCCLLESSIKYIHIRGVKMHDLIRGMALAQASQSFMVKAGVNLREIPNEQEWTEDLEKVSLMRNDISEIPPGTSLSCPRLSTLLLKGNPLKSIPDSFFEHMPGLRVLNLSVTNIELLPNSISNLENLTALLVRKCGKLIYVPPLGKLKALTDLDLGETAIEELPHGLQGLFNLKYLYARARLVKVRADELQGLEQLEEFTGQLSDLCEFNRFVKSECCEQLCVYHLFVSGTRYPTFYSYIGGDKFVVVEKCSLKRGEGGEDGLLLPRNIQSLTIIRCYDMSSCLLDVSPSLINARGLKNICIDGCGEIECILTISSSDEREFSQLQSLQNFHLYNFSALCKREGVISPPNSIFSNLKYLAIKDCPKIKKLFSAGSLLHALEVLHLFHCEQLEEIIAEEEEEEEEEEAMGGTSSSNPRPPPPSNYRLPNLQGLILCNLPKLKSISRGTMICDSIKEIEINRCPKLERLPFFLGPLDEQPSPPLALKKIRITGELWESVVLDHPNAKTVLQPFIWRL